ncbi:MAG: NYN domain-containing protein [Deltaproteobacteria bacterium]|nr:NYN domain-containing protein [Deltaproteobacteria bacterium]
MAHIIIDGYNLIRRSHSLSRAEAVDLERGRLELLKKLAAWRQTKHHAVTVVFDAGETLNLSVEEDRFAGIRILYSKGGQTADSVMIDLARKLREQAIVVSSDNEILQAAKRSGCSFLLAEEFERKLNAVGASANKSWRTPLPETDRDRPDENRPLNKRWMTMKKGPAKRLPKAKRRAMARLRDL